MEPGHNVCCWRGILELYRVIFTGFSFESTDSLFRRPPQQGGELMGQATSNGKSTRLGDSQAGHWLQTRIRFLSVFLFFVAVCVCVLFPRKRRGEEGKRTRWEAARKFFLFFFSLLFIYPLIYDSSKWRLPAPPWRRCSCCHPSKRRFGFGFKKFQRVYVGSHLVVPSFTVIFVSVWVLAGFFWVFLDFTGFYWVCLGFIGFYWTWVRFTGFYWVYWTFIVFVRVFTVFFCILLEFTGFYWVGVGLCLGFIGF